METQSTPDVIPAIAAAPIEIVKVKATEQVSPRPVRRWRARVFQVYLVVATAAFGILVVLASTFNYFAVDLSVTRSVQRINAAWFASLMEWVSFLGYAPQMYVLVAAIARLVVSYWIALGIGCGACGRRRQLGGLGQLVKIVVHRPRPGANLVNVLQQLNSYSFPSGHVLTYTAFFGFLFFLGYTLLKPSFVRTVLLVILGILVALIGISRIYVGDHWASDAVGAYLLGSLWLVLCVSIYRWGKTRYFCQAAPGSGKARANGSKP